jgi:hypothetical protein
MMIGRMIDVLVWEAVIDQTEDSCLQGCSAVYTGMGLPTFHRSVLPPSSGQWVKPRARNQ